MTLNLVVGGPISSHEQAVNDSSGGATALWLSATGATIAGNKTNLGVQLTVYNASGATDQSAGIQFLTGANRNMALRCPNGDNWLEVVDSTGTVRGAWRGDTYTVGGLTVTGPSVMFTGLTKPASGTADLVINSSGGIGMRPSSARFKENVEPLEDDFHKILMLTPKSFTYKDSGDAGIGYMAEELDDAKLERLVSYDKDGKPLSIDYKMMSIYLLEVLKEHQQVIQDLQREMANIKEMMQ